MDYALDILVIERGAVAFTDRHLPRPFEIDFSALNGEWQEINSDQAGDGQLLLKGQVSDGSPMRIEGAFDPLSDALNGNLNLHFERLDLETFAPYLRKFGGYAVEGGQATLNLDYRLVQGRLIAKNHVVLHRLELGKEVNASATGLPLKTLIDVLKSEDGVIELDIPMRLPLDEPSAVDFGSVAGQAIREALENLVSSPLETLSAVVDDDGERPSTGAESTAAGERRENGAGDGRGKSEESSEAGPALYERARTIQ